MVLEVGGRGAVGFRIIKEMHRTVIIFMVLEVGGRGAAGFRSIRTASDYYDFHGSGSGQEGGGCLPNHKKS